MFWSHLSVVVLTPSVDAELKIDSAREKLNASNAMFGK